MAEALLQPLHGFHGLLLQLLLHRRVRKGAPRGQRGRWLRPRRLRERLRRTVQQPLALRAEELLDIAHGAAPLPMLPWEILWNPNGKIWSCRCWRYLYLQSMAVLRWWFTSGFRATLFGAIEMEKVKMFQWSHWSFASGDQHVLWFDMIRWYLVYAMVGKGLCLEGMVGLTVWRMVAWDAAWPWDAES